MKNWMPYPQQIPPKCPECGNKVKTTKFRNGIEVYCSVCDWEIWLQNPHYSNIHLVATSNEEKDDEE